MKAIPMKGRLTGKRIRGFLWAGTGTAWTKKENYFQPEDAKLVSAVLASSSGQFWFRCKGASCEVKLLDPSGKVLSTAVLALPRGRK